MPPKKAPPKKDGAADEKDYDLENFMLQKRLEVIQHRIQLKEEVIVVIGPHYYRGRMDVGSG